MLIVDDGSWRASDDRKMCDVTGLGCGCPRALE